MRSLERANFAKRSKICFLKVAKCLSDFAKEAVNERGKACIHQESSGVTSRTAPAHCTGSPIYLHKSEKVSF